MRVRTSALHGACVLIGVYLGRISMRGSISSAASHRELLGRVYPLATAAEHWRTIPWDRYQIILVTGPQRSGTTWTACTLAVCVKSPTLAQSDHRHPLHLSSQLGACNASNTHTNTLLRTHTSGVFLSLFSPKGTPHLPYISPALLSRAHVSSIGIPWHASLRRASSHIWRQRHAACDETHVRVHSHQGRASRHPVSNGDADPPSSAEIPRAAGGLSRTKLPRCLPLTE